MGAQRANPPHAEPAPPKPTPLVDRAVQPPASAELLPNDHVRLLTELLRHGNQELARRWVAALMLVPEADRAGVVEAVEAQIVAEYASGPADGEPGARGS